MVVSLGVITTTPNQLVVVPANPLRKFLLIQVRSGRAWIKFNGTPSAPYTDSIELTGPGLLQLNDPVPTNGFNVVVERIGTGIVILEDGPAL